MPVVKPNRMSIVTLGVKDLEASARFYEKIFGVAPDRSNDGVRFFHLPGVWLTVFPLSELAKDIGLPESTPRSGFSGITLAHNARSRDDVLAIFDHVKSAGATIVKEPHDTFWGGFSGYFADPDGYYWEVAWGPMFDFDPDGTLAFKK